MQKLNKIKLTEAQTLQTFQQEIPSNYYFKKSKKDFQNFLKNAEHMYKFEFKLPKEVFKNKKLIDYGAGTGENTVYLANWGAECTLIEMNPIAHNISKKVFKKYAINKKKHKFINSSIFDFKPKKKFYDIVHCRGVLSHTAGKEKAFKKIASSLKKDGFLIFGDPNKSGGFQNMLQRYCVYKFSKNTEDMVKVSEYLFKDDIDRSQRAVPRTRREIIFDRWVIQSQDDPSIGEVIRWMKQCNLKLYSSYPYLPNFFSVDSFYHKRKTSIENFSNILSLSEYLWMTHTKDDVYFLNNINSYSYKFSKSINDLSKYLMNCNANTKINFKKFKSLINNIKLNTKDYNPIKNQNIKSQIFFNETIKFIELVQKGDITKVRNFLKKTNHLFKHAVGIRHADYVAYKTN